MSNLLFSERLKKLLETGGHKYKRPVSQSELSKVLGITRQSISAYLHEDTLPTIDKLKLIAEFFDVSYDYLMGYSESEIRENSDIVERLGLSEDTITSLSSLKNLHKCSKLPGHPPLQTVLDLLISSFVSTPDVILQLHKTCVQSSIAHRRGKFRVSHNYNTWQLSLFNDITAVDSAKLSLDEDESLDVYKYRMRRMFDSIVENIIHDSKTEYDEYIFERRVSLLEEAADRTTDQSKAMDIRNKTKAVVEMRSDDMDKCLLWLSFLVHKYYLDGDSNGDD